MTSLTLAQSYLKKAQIRLKILDVLLAEQAYSDIVREAQELVELALKGLLRQIGVEPPKQHDVGSLVVEFRGRLPAEVAAVAERLASISKWLRKERELSFYGDVDFIPTAEYTRDDADRAIADAQFVVVMAALTIPVNPPHESTSATQSPPSSPPAAPPKTPGTLRSADE
jgi:HEPN domain-containing protein